MNEDFKEPSLKEKGKKAEENHIWLNAFACIDPTDEFKISLANQILSWLDNKDRTLKTTIGLANMLYLSINKS